MMDEVSHWLEGLGLGRYAAAFAENDIEFDLLSELTDADLEKLGVSSLGHRKRLLKAIAALSGETAAPVDTTLAKAAAEIPPPADAGTSGCSGPVAAPEEPTPYPPPGYGPRRVLKP